MRAGSMISSSASMTRVSRCTSPRHGVHQPVSEGRAGIKARGSPAQAVVPGLEAGIVALYQKCPHLGCRVPFCGTSKWFECPCHGSQYTRVGEKTGGPAPRGMDLFPVSLERGAVTVDTGFVIQGMPIGTNTSGQAAEGPHCVSARAE